jgi:RHS repeat-associated protein
MTRFEGAGLKKIHRHFGFLLVAVLAPSFLQAQDGVWASQTAWVEPHEEYGKHVAAASRTAPLGSDLFGESVSLYNGQTEFSVVDVSVPGNGALPVEFRRRYKVENREGSRNVGGAGNWDIDVPHLYGTFGAGGWTLPGPTSNRCSNVQAPAISSFFLPEEMWSGNYLHIPGEGDSEILASLAGKLPAVQDGHTYPWVTGGKWRLRCTAMLSNNGFNGQGFIAVSPSGVKYTFNYGYQETGQSMGRFGGPGFVDERKHVWLFATRIEDRFGNVVNLAYSGKNLTSVSSSDGRLITVHYQTVGNLPRVHQVKTADKTWTYAYGTQNLGKFGYPLTQVTRPDSSTWKYDYPLGGFMFGEYFSPVLEGEDPTCSPSMPERSEHVLEITHPAGAKGRFELVYDRHLRSGTPFNCNQHPMGGWSLTTPNYFDNFTLTKKTITGPGLPAMVWSYDYSGYPADFTYAPAFCPGCDTRKKVVVTKPDGSREVSEFGISYGVNEGLLLAVETQSAAATVLNRATTAYLPVAAVGTMGFPGRYGASIRSMDPVENLIRPALETQLSQDGVRFETTYQSFDALANPTSVRRRSVSIPSGAVRDSRTESVEYEHNYVHWVIGQVRRIGLTAPEAMQLARVEFNALAQPIKLFGMRQPDAALDPVRQEVAYYGAGSAYAGRVSTIKDGNGQTTTLSNWYRGIPRTVQFADGTSRSAMVSPLGWVTSVTDENGFATSYGHDAMGRVNQVTHPGGDSVAWAPTTISTVQVSTAEYGIAGGHWRETVSTGNARKETYFDALWRPLVVREYDAANVATTSRFTVQAYDHEGRPVFSAYPLVSLGTIAGATQGVWTQYDPLGRTQSISQDSESGLLTTLTEYLPGFQTRVTNPRGHQTVTAYQAFDQPDTSSPSYIVAPEGATTSIQRDSLGRAISLARFGSQPGQIEAATRQYVYDAHGRLCKTIEPETGATVMKYDAAGNMIWSAAGLGLPDPAQSSCDAARATAEFSGRRVDRTYDVRNRISTLAFPDGRGNQAFVYTLDGLPSQITTNNAAGSHKAINTYTYNRRRLLTAETLAQPGWYTWGIGYGYDANGSLASQGYPTGLSVNYAPNALGQPTQAGSYATGVLYHPNGAIKQFTYGNGLVHTMVQNARQLPAISTDTGGALNQTYHYDANGNVGHVADNLDGARSRWMSYDALDRLTDAGSPVFGGDHWHRFSYDAIDNLLSWRHGYVKENSYQYNAKNQLKDIYDPAGNLVHQFSYDVQGNITSRNSVPHDFDFGNRLRSVPGIEDYRYDGLGRRVHTAKASGAHTLWMYSRDGQMLFSSKLPTAGGQTTHENVYLGGSLVATIDHAWPSNAVLATKYQHTDALGSPVAVTNEAGAVIERTNYDPYGGPIGKVVDGIGYTGHVMDPATGLTYMQQRYYDPAIGRFLSVDPITASSINGGNFNRYWYANNSPFRFTDPDGRVAIAKAGDQTRVESDINSQSEQQYAFNSEGQLAQMEGCINSSGSSSYSQDIDVTIGATETVNLGIAQSYRTPSGQVKDIDYDDGGGISGTTSSGYVVKYTGNPAPADVDVSGNVVNDQGADVLRHEITGHVAPGLRGESGSARDFDNKSRKELGKPELAPSDPNGYSDPVRSGQ